MLLVTPWAHGSVQRLWPIPDWDACEKSPPAPPLSVNDRGPRRGSVSSRYDPGAGRDPIDDALIAVAPPAASDTSDTSGTGGGGESLVPPPLGGYVVPRAYLVRRRHAAAAAHQDDDANE